MEDAKILQQGYDIRLISSYRTRSGLVCRTDRGLLELKKTFFDDSALETEEALREYLFERGFRGTERIVRTTDNLPAYRVDENAYILVKYSAGTSLDTENINDLKFAAGGLAFFHNAAEGFSHENLRKNSVVSEEVYKRRYRELSAIRKRITKFGEYSPVDRIVMEYCGYYLERINHAAELLKKADCERLLLEADKKQSICHNAFKGENIMRGENGNALVSGLAGCTADMSIADLSVILRKYIKNTSADEKGIISIIGAYDEVRSVNSEEMGVIKGMLVYPYKFLKLCSEHYNKRRVCISEAAVERFMRCTERREKEDILAESL